MARTTFSSAQMEKIGGGGWLELWRFKGAAPFPCEIAARKKRNFYAAKCLLLNTEKDIPQEKSTEPNAFCRTVLRVGPDNISVLFLASDHPITYFPELQFTENYQIEIPGGVAEPDEDQRHTALREAIEEGGLAVQGDMAFIQSTSLIDVPVPFDAGSHVELYSIEAALVHGKPKPPAKEGIIPDQCELIPLPEALNFLYARQGEGICVEGYAMTALITLEFFLWKSLHPGQYPQEQLRRDT